jgi:PAS domain-containing protein
MVVSAHFLDRIARALRLDATERGHLFTLAHNRPPPILPVETLEVTPALRRMLEAVEGPAYLATASMYVIAWNRALVAVFGEMENIPADNRNMLWLVFASPAHRAAIPDWETDARAMMARFRIEFGRHRDDPAFVELVARLTRASDEFRHWWPEQDVSTRQSMTKKFHVSGIGEVELEQNSFLIEEAPDMRLVIYVPIDQRSAEKVAQLRRG